MSKAAKRSLFILIALLLLMFGFIVFSVMEKKAVEEEKARVEQEFMQAEQRFQKQERKFLDDAKSLKGQVQSAETEKKRLERELEKVNRQVEDQVSELRKLQTEIADITDDRDKWKRRIETIRAERDKLMGRVNGLKEKLEDAEDRARVLELASTKQGTKKEDPVETQPVVRQTPSYVPVDRGGDDNDHWASIIKQKAALEVEVEKLKDELTDKNIEVVEIKQKNEDLQIEIDSVRQKEQEILDQIRHKTDMIDNISLELARTKNDKNFVSGRLEELGKENKELRQEMKQLLSVKSALQKSIVRVSQEKDKVEGKLGQTETIIQSKIDEIWEIKDDLDRSIRSAKGGDVASEVELPPIVVRSEGQETDYQTMTPSGFNGKVISINEPNNFVIVDIGGDDGVRLGDSLSVYRDSDYIARLEVIQVRKDISAADLKDQWSKIKVGDVIR